MQFEIYDMHRFPFPLTRASALRFAVEGAGREDRTLAALPALFPFIEFTGSKLVRMSRAALALMAAIDREHGPILIQLCLCCPRILLYDCNLLILLWRRERDSEP